MLVWHSMHASQVGSSSFVHLHSRMESPLTLRSMSAQQQLSCILQHFYPGHVCAWQELRAQGNTVYKAGLTEQAQNKWQKAMKVLSGMFDIETAEQVSLQDQPPRTQMSIAGPGTGKHACLQSAYRACYLASCMI